MNEITDMFATSRWTRAALNVTINHLVSIVKLRVLSRPKLVCLSGKEAEFLVGGQIPIVTTTTSTTSTSNNVQFKDYGIQLKIKPVVKNDENIFVSISTEISEVDKDTATINSIPAFLTRNTKTELYLKNEQSLVISGLIKNREADTVSKFPGMADLPILGMLFRSQEFPAESDRVGDFAYSHHSFRFACLGRKDIPSGAGQGKYENKAERSLREFRGKDEKGYSSGLDSYIDDIKGQIVSSLGYPSLARELGVCGTVKVRLRILSDGWLKEALVVGSSGSELLDNSTLRSIKKLAPFSSFPGSLKETRLP